MVRKKKLLKGEEEDRISELPDPLLGHILSFLPFKNIVATSVLAKRWRFIWNSVPILKITHWLSTDPTKDRDLQIKLFVNFMDRMFVLRDLSTIKYFYLFSYYIKDDYIINSWISAVIRRKVEEIHLLLPHWGVYTPFLIPSSLFTCESLVTLRMSVPVVLNLPRSVHFPKLKLLTLQHVRIKDKYFIERLLSNCPVLEELGLESCRWDGIADLCIASPTLKRLSITKPPCGEININAPRLEYFSCTRFLVKKHPADVNSETSIPEQASNSINLLGALAPTEDHLLLKLPTFHNLSDLVVIWSYPSLIDRALFRLLQISPKLESLALDNENAPRSNEDDSWKLNTVPECPKIVSGLEHLKELEFIGFSGDPWEMITILEVGLQTKLQITTKLLTLPRASSSCVIIFS
ncbi:hypothetical protein MKW98_007221 [Papaver atlanticum]|uniref:F-box domain-containing protein n=1 Tax=Papaver atlanticum TaxID=357466 RepID=A0AAD4SLL5_9MAGN|nr:hypothetical protein MKW98_007221 [Papaver atlanticum]